ncbi:MAG TPA: glutamate--tRNA ligase [Stellaceae bacterium]|nr:glutamate--tRNA ligase [Stellaceae bacterium]
MSVVVRFAPSPTGFLHIGGARTALFNWLYARHTGGTFRLRIEDTDRARSTQSAVDAIIDGLKWLGLDWDGEIVMQSARQEAHAAAVSSLVAAGHAYPCYCTAAELEAMREKARAEGRTALYDGRCRDLDPNAAPKDRAPAIRLKAPREGATVIADHVQGTVTVANLQLDDLILLRGDGTPTYNLSVVVDDHDMGVTHVIRGDDHFTNAFRQTQIYRALGWAPPEFAHVPLIHGPDGAKLSKRHGAMGVDAYRDMGYLPEALRNYLLRLGWSHGDDEIIPTADAVRWFDLDAIGRSPARFDFAKLGNVNAHYIRETSDTRLVDLTAPIVEGRLGAALADAQRDVLLRAMPALKPRAKTLVELAERAQFYVAPRPIPLEAKAAALLDEAATARLAALAPALAEMPWQAAELEAAVRRFAEGSGVKLGDIAQPLRAALAGATASPGIFEVMEALGRNETLGRIADAVDRD